MANWFGNMFNWYLGWNLMLFWIFCGDFLALFGTYQPGFDMMVATLDEWRPPSVGDIYHNPMKIGI